MTHKPRIWRDIDKHPLPNENCTVDVKLVCGSTLLSCEYNLKYYWPVIFMMMNVDSEKITQWRISK